MGPLADLSDRWVKSHPPFILNTPKDETMAPLVGNFHIPLGPWFGGVFDNRGMGLMRL